VIEILLRDRLVLCPKQPEVALCIRSGGPAFSSHGPCRYDVLSQEETTLIVCIFLCVMRSNVKICTWRHGFRNTFVAYISLISAERRPTPGMQSTEVRLSPINVSQRWLTWSSIVGEWTPVIRRTF
jgi:hypothetical protein